jgi:hypothetical protein
MERCDHEGTTEPLEGMAAISVCTVRERTWPTRFGAGAPTVRIVEKQVGLDGVRAARVNHGLGAALPASRLVGKWVDQAHQEKR